MVQPSLQELQSHSFFPSSHSPEMVVQEVCRNWCCSVDTAGSITRGTRKQKVAALKVFMPMRFRTGRGRDWFVV